MKGIGPIIWTPDRRTTIYLIIAVVVVLRSPTLLDSMYLVDEAYYATIADDLMRGGILYRTSVDTKPPFMYYIYEWTMQLAGRDNLRAVHILAILVVIATALTVGRIGFMLGGVGVEFWSALGSAVFTHAYLPRDTLAANSEIFASFPLSLSILCFLYGLRRMNGIGGFLASGMLCAIATGIRQPSIINLAVFGSYLLYIGIYTRTIRLATAVRAGLWVGTGFLSIVGGMAWYYSTQGNLTDAYHWAWVYAMHYVDAETTVSYLLLRLLKVHLTFIIASGVLWFFGLKAIAIIMSAHMRAGKEAPEPVLIVFWFVLTYMTVFIGWRFPGHYHLSLIPALSVLAGWTFKPFWEGLRRLAPEQARRRRRQIAVAVSAPVIGFLIVAFIIREQTLAIRDVAKAIKARTQPEDRIFVWGSRPEIYYFSGRRMATRFVSCSHLTGIYASRPRGDFDTSGSVVPGSWTMFENDLRAHPPELIIDMSPVLSDWKSYPMGKYTIIYKFLKNYYIDDIVEGIIIYRRIS